MVRNAHARLRAMESRRISKLFTLLIATLLTWSYCIPAPVALAEDIDTDPTPDELQQRIEQTAAELEDAKAQVEAANAAIEAQKAQIAELEELIPEQQARSDQAARELYKFEQEAPGILELLLNSDDFFDFLNNLDYVNRISEANIAEINRLNTMKAELEASGVELEAARADAEQRAAEADAALVAAQAARLEAQRRAQEAARQEAEAAAAAAAAANAASGTGAAVSAPESAGQAGVTLATPADDGADWSEDEAAFIANWAPRIDAYLAGSPLAGQGTTFARAAWQYGVDPRWSPAISFTESSKGEVCFLPHNAWGWGSVSWGSWEEAIDAHVRGLARGYGYTISMEAAQKYCPPNAQAWYERTLGQMNLI